MDQLLEIIFSNQSLMLITLGSAFLCVAFLVHLLMPDEKEAAARRVLGVIDDSERTRNILLIKILHPLLAATGNRFRSVKNQRIANYKRTRRDLLIAGGLSRELTPEEFIGFKIVMIVLLPLLAHYVAVVLGMTMQPYVYLILIVLGFFSPDLWLFEIVKKRRRAISRAMPYTIDLLTLSVEAGLDFMAAIKRLTVKSKPNPLIEELQIALNEISLGTSRSDALRNLAKRLQMEEMNSFTSLLVQADQLGASIGLVLRAQADSLRTSRFQKAEIAGAKASQYLLFPMIFFIFPTVFIIIVGPLLVRYLTQGLFGLF